MISSEIHQVHAYRIDCCAPHATRTTSNRSHLRFTSFRCLRLGAVLLALFLSQTTPADAIAIDSQTAPTVPDAYDNGAVSLHQILLNAREGTTIAFDVPASDPGYDGRAWTFGLTSGHLATDKNATSSGFAASLLTARRSRDASSANAVNADSYHPVAMEDLMINDGLAPPLRLVILTAGGTAMLFLSLALFYRHLQRPTGKRVRFGILWDVYKPICGKCGSLLDVLNDYSFQCPTCQVELGARGENGRTISPREALVKIRLKEYW